MAVADNVRTQYQDGLVLGAAQLSGDQTYLRAALERRSLARDLFGIAWGLELNVETAPASSPSSAIVRVNPGVAYGGDGKPIVLRSQAEVSSMLVSSGAGASTSWAVYIAYAETTQSGKSGFSFCGQAMDPTIAESTLFIVELFGSVQSDGEREGARAEPQGQLGGLSDATVSRVLLGVVDYDAASLPSVRRAPGAVAIPPAKTTATQKELASANAPPAEAEYIGVVASAIVHPRAWTASRANSGRAEVSPAIEIDAQDGIHLRQKTVCHDAVLAEGMLIADALIVAKSGLAIARSVDPSTTTSALTNLAVALRSTGVVAAQVASGPPIVDDTQGVIGIATGPYDDPVHSVSVVFSGLAVATLTGTANPGEWLVLDPGAPGKLKAAPTLPGVGTLVAKLVEMQSATTALVLVALG